MTLIDHEQLAAATGVLGRKGANGLEVVLGPNLVRQVNDALSFIASRNFLFVDERE